MSNQLVAELGLTENELAAHQLDYEAYLKELEWAELSREAADRDDACRERDLEKWLEEVEMAYAYREFTHGFAPLD